MTMRSDSLDFMDFDLQAFDLHSPGYNRAHSPVNIPAEDQPQLADMPEAHAKSNAKSIIENETKHIEQTWNNDQLLGDDFLSSSALHDVDEFQQPDGLYTALNSNDTKRKRSNEGFEDFPCVHENLICDDEFEDQLGLSDPENADASASQYEEVYSDAELKSLEGTESVMPRHATMTYVVKVEDHGFKVEDPGPKGDQRGKHWAQKVDEGRPPEPWKDTKIWADRRKEKEAEFDGFVKKHSLLEVLPWRVRGGRATGNTQKVLYMELLMHHVAGVAELERGPAADGFFGIRRVRVPPAGRAAFDAGAIPSLASRRHAATPDAKARLKALVKIWETAGFREAPPDAAGGLVLDYDAATFAKQKLQQTSKPKGPSAKRPRAA